MIYDKVKVYCDKHGNMSILKFEKLCGLPNGMVGKWKEGGSKPRLESIEKIAKATKTSVKSWV